MEVARESIDMFLNSRMVEAEELFRHHQDNRQVRMAQCYCSVMSAVVTFESAQLERTLQLLKATEKAMTPDTGLVNQLRTKLKAPEQLEESEVVGLLERQIAVADCQVCAAVINFLEQDVGSCVRGSWGLRRAWKTYDRIYGQISSLYREGRQDRLENAAEPGEGRAAEPAARPLIPSSASSPNLAAPAAPSGLRRSATRLHVDQARPVSAEAAEELMGSVSLGYGLFQLTVSLLPAKFVKVVQLLGFQSDRSAALAALMFCRTSRDMRAPLASLALLWYHSVVRPLLSLDGRAVSAGVAVCHQLLRETEGRYGQAALFQFFRGRLLRLESDLSGAIGAYEVAASQGQQGEVRLLCLHEIGWCRLLQLDWVEAFVAFSELAEQSRWSKAFYQYLSALCTGASGDITLASALLKDIPPPGRGRSELDTFLESRAAALREPRAPPAAQLACRLHAYELLYLWNALPSCPQDVWKAVVEDCERGALELPPLAAVAHLVCGGVFDNTCLREAERHYIRALHLGKDDSRRAYVAPHASYELAAMYCAQAKRRAEGRALLLSARDDYKDYDFESRLAVRIQAALKRLEKTGREQKSK
ncbi:tetratricopeptide repeat protein 39C-like [Amphibalanus amphitrite]|uniref:tetratricopeptide repeat protein 39C-like n=1 Tax=Amphibalanus amphitrite TaxID=1232801 RepID=UPI001C9214FA|nr:tetratricopeptide repeat protein 39C-like [Amphibalanus amphitrite]